MSGKKQVIARICYEKKINPSELARMIQLTSSAVSNDKRMSLDLATAIADLYPEYDFDFLFGRAPNPRGLEYLLLDKTLMAKDDKVEYSSSTIEKRLDKIESKLDDILTFLKSNTNNLNK
jgi:hypothetical protein